MNDLLKLAIRARGGMDRWEQISRFRVAASITHRQTVETADGVLVAERLDPAASFAGTTRSSPWDDFQAAYLAGEANWNYFVAPLSSLVRTSSSRKPGPGRKTGRSGGGCS